jgi:hypothetical protein
MDTSEESAAVAAESPALSTMPWNHCPLWVEYALVQIRKRLRCKRCGSREVTIVFLAPNQKTGSAAYLFSETPLPLPRLGAVAALTGPAPATPEIGRRQIQFERIWCAYRRASECVRAMMNAGWHWSA